MSMVNEGTNMDQMEARVKRLELRERAVVGLLTQLCAAFQGYEADTEPPQLCDVPEEEWPLPLMQRALSAKDLLL